MPLVNQIITSLIQQNVYSAYRIYGHIGHMANTLMVLTGVQYNKSDMIYCIVYFYWTELWTICIVLIGS